MNKKHTEAESLLLVQSGIFALEKRFLQGKMNLQDIKSIVPCYLHLNNANTVAVEYIDPDISRDFPISPEDVEADGMAALKKLCHPLDFMNLTQTVPSCLENSDPYSTISIFERLRQRLEGDIEYNLYFTIFRLINQDQCLGVTLPTHNMNNMANKISGILDDYEFLKTNFQRFASLTKREKKILSLLAGGKNNPGISEELFISRRTVENHRKSIIKKLELKNFAHLIQFAKAFDLV